MAAIAIPPRHTPKEIQIQVSGTGYFLVVIINQKGEPILSDDGTAYYARARAKALDLRFLFHVPVPVYFNEKGGKLYIVGERGGVTPYYTMQAVNRELAKAKARGRAR